MNNFKHYESKKIEWRLKFKQHKATIFLFKNYFETFNIKKSVL